MKPDPFTRLMESAQALEVAQIHFLVSRYRDDAISIQAAVPGERWEIDVMADGQVDFERFVSDGGVTRDEAVLYDFIARFAEPAAEGQA